MSKLIQRGNMSHFATIETQFRDKECLLKALQAIGLTPQEHAQPVSLKNYYGKREGQAHIVVPSCQINNRADIGFYWNGRCYEVIVDDYDVDNWWRFKSKQRSGFRQSLTVEYQVQVAISAGCEIASRELLPDGSIRVIAKKKVTAQKQALNNRIGGKR